MKYRTITLALLLVAGPAAIRHEASSKALPLPDVVGVLSDGHAKTMATDFKCLNDCTSSGHLYQFCQSKCNYPDSIPTAPPQNAQPHGTDFKCLNECTSSGHMYAFCKDKCSY
jgi:hypothetical protein